MSEEIVHVKQLEDHESDATGVWTINVELGLLKDDSGAEKRLEPRLSKLMNLLLINQGNFVSRRELIDDMWPDAVVSEQSLTRAVADLRKFLYTNYPVPPVIETASKQGYRLSFPANEATSDGPSNVSFRNILRMGAYGLGALVLFTLVIRGLNY